jgi:hypothetical protein
MFTFLWRKFQSRRLRRFSSWRRLTAVTLQFGWLSAPFCWINVRDGLRETPMVPGEVLDVILSFAISEVRGFPKDPYTASPGMVVVRVDILDPHHDCSPQRDIRARFDQDNSTPIADIQLSAVIPHSNAEGKSERVAQPINCIPDVWVRQFRNHNAARHGSIGKHPCDFTNTRIGISAYIGALSSNGLPALADQTPRPATDLTRPLHCFR